MPPIQSKSSVHLAVTCFAAENAARYDEMWRFGDSISDVDGLPRLISKQSELRSSLASDFVKNLLVVDPDRRMTAPEALEHPWIKNQNLASDCIDEAMDTCPKRCCC